MTNKKDEFIGYGILVLLMFILVAWNTLDIYYLRDRISNLETKLPQKICHNETYIYDLERNVKYPVVMGEATNIHFNPIDKFVIKEEEVCT